MQPPQPPPAVPPPPPSDPAGQPPAAMTVPTGAPAPDRSAVPVVVGLLLTVPAAIALLVSHVIPTVQTLLRSVRDPRTEDPVGGEYYQAAMDELPQLLGTSLSTAGLPLLTLLGLGPLLAWAAYRAGKGFRWTTRLVLTVPMVCIAPAAIGLLFFLQRRSTSDSLWLIEWLTIAGLLVGVGTTVFLAVWQGRQRGRSTAPAALAVGAVTGLTVVAIALQTFALPMLLPSRHTTIMLGIYQHGFIFLNRGTAAALATMLICMLAVLGIAATLVIILSRMRLTVSRPEPTSAATGIQATAAVVTVVGLLGTVALTIVVMWPWLTSLTDLTVAGSISTGRLLLNTWVPPLLSTVVGVGLAALAGFGIGGLRPLGRWSELLLLPFAPWLFIHIGPLMLAKEEAARTALEGEPGGFLLLIPRVWLVVPALVLFTLLFRGLRETLSATAPDRPPYWEMITRALPMLLLVGGATWLLQTQSLLWQNLTARGEHSSVLIYLITQVSVHFDTGQGHGLILPLPIIAVFAIGLGLLQVRYLDRIAIQVGRPLQ
jgi:hypothetical protein